jgi:diguanylate cyclase (GGDEF)-like protein/PAS domain S-box-containing protein
MDIYDACDSLNVGMIVVDQHGMVLYTNYKANEIIGIGDEGTQQKTVKVGKWFSLLHNTDKDPLIKYPIERALEGEFVKEEYYVKDSFFLVQCNPVLKSSDVVGGAILLIDITERKTYEKQLESDALYDKMTGLPNRALFCEHLTKTIERQQREIGFMFSVLFVDCDKLKEINDTYGHPAGDELIYQLAGRLKKSIRQTDIVARLGGDEFVILLSGITEPILQSVLKRLTNELNNPYKIEEKYLEVTASVGVTRGRQSEQDPITYIKEADQAMYTVKRTKTGGYAFYEGVVMSDNKE